MSKCTFYYNHSNYYNHSKLILCHISTFFLELNWILWEESLYGTISEHRIEALGKVSSTYVVYMERNRWPAPTMAITRFASWADFVRLWSYWPIFLLESMWCVVRAEAHAYRGQKKILGGKFSIKNMRGIFRDRSSTENNMTGQIIRFYHNECLHLD
jgi:hypothetical protein